jgi:signal peptidase II
VTSRQGFPPWLWAPLVLLVDFVSKRLVLANAEELAQRVEVLGDLVRLTYVRNPGAAMGLFPVGREVLVAVSLAATLFLIFLYLRSHRDLRIRRAAIAMVLGGAVGNLIDRIFYDGLVVDFIDVGIGASRFYTFNVADAGVTVGGVILFLSLLTDRGDHSSAAAPVAAPPTDDG